MNAETKTIRIFTAGDDALLRQGIAAPDAPVGVEQHVRDAGGRVVEMRWVGRIRRIEAELQADSLRDTEVVEDRDEFRHPSQRFA